MRGTVLAFGTFDVFHLGHVKFFQAARRLGKRLVVVVARDKNVRCVKGRMPYFSERERLQLVSSLKAVDSAVLGSQKNRYAIIARLKPDVVVLGYDQAEDESRLKEKLVELRSPARIVRLKPFEPKRHKSWKVKNFVEKC